MLTILGTTIAGISVLAGISLGDGIVHGTVILTGDGVVLSIGDGAARYITITHAITITAPCGLTVDTTAMLQDSGVMADVPIQAEGLTLPALTALVAEMGLA